MKKNIRFCSMYSAFVSTIITLFATGLVGTASICLAQDSPWTTKADIPTPRRLGSSSSVVNGKIYAIGGDRARTKVEEYNPANNHWTALAKTPMLPGRAFFATSVVTGKIYAIGGSLTSYRGRGIALTEEYDPATDTWTTKKDMPTARHGICAGVVDEKIYVIAGDRTGHDNPPVTKVEMYDPATDTWTPKQDMPTARWRPSCGVVNGKIYVFGGLLYRDGPSTNVVEMYDPATDSWTPKADMPQRRTGHAAAVVDSQVHIFGGLSRAGAAILNNHWIYNPTTDAWDTSLPNMPFNWLGMGDGVVNKRVYLMAGTAVPFPYGDRLRRVAEYNPHNDLSRLVENVNVDRSYARPATDNVIITTKIKNPTGITLFAEIKTPDQTPVDSLQLFDDGTHGDGSAGDSLFANSWPVQPVVESNYYIDLQVTRVDADTVNHHFNNMATFTTKGPVKIDHVDIVVADGVASPGDIVSANLYFQNNGKTATIENIRGHMTILDSCITNDSPLTKLFLNSLSAGEVKLAVNFFRIKIAENCPTGQIPVQVDIYEAGTLYWADTFYVEVKSPVSVKDKSAVSPDRFALHQNYPNPFNPETTIQYQIPKRSEVKLIIFSLLGQRVTTLVDKVQSMGIHSVQWDGKDDTGKKVASGVYLYRLQTNQFVQVKKLALLR